MPTVTELREQLDRLNMARATGVRAVRHGDTETEYRSDSELAAAISALERKIANATGKPVSLIYVNSSKGV